MFYCDMGPLGAEINRSISRRMVGQYVIFQGKEIFGQLSYKAHTIVTLNADGNMIWYKHRDRPELALLTKDEQAAMVLQILKSETW